MCGHESNLTDVLIRRKMLDTQKDTRGLHTESTLCEDTARRQPSANQAERLQEIPNLMTALS